MTLWTTYGGQLRKRPGEPVNTNASSTLTAVVVEFYQLVKATCFQSRQSIKTSSSYRGVPKRGGPMEGGKLFESCGRGRQRCGGGGAGQDPGSDGFDISDVDVTNFPVLRGNCGEIMGGNGTYDSCLKWERNPDIRIAGWQSTDKAYVQVKIPNGDDSQIAAAKSAVIQSKKRGLNEDNVEIIPVNHDYEELWRWSIILDRFARSSGNTLGITSAQLGYNINRYAGEPAVVWPLNDIQEAHDNRPEWRTIIHLQTLDVPGTAAALPQLLSQLSIPVDAVGLIVEEVFTPPSRWNVEPGQRPSAGVDNSSALSSDLPTEHTAVAGTGQRANSIVVMSASLVVGLAVLGGAGFIMIRRRRAMSPGV